MDGEIDNLVKSCSVCQQSRPAPAVAPLHSWEWPSGPWNLNFAGPFMGHMFLLIMDAHSKWLDVHHPFPPPTLLKRVARVFAIHGLPHKVVTDNGSSFSSKDYMSSNGIIHVTTAPYHPASNGLVVKRNFPNSFLTTVLLLTRPWELHLRNYQRLRSRFDRLFPDLQGRVQKKQAEQAASHNNSKPLRSFKIGDSVYTKISPLLPYCGSRELWSK